MIIEKYEDIPKSKQEEIFSIVRKNYIIKHALL